MTGVPTVQVLMDDVNNGGTFPYDISAYVRLRDGVKASRGRGDEFSEVQPGSVSLTLENIDGRFTLGSTVGGYGAINVNRRIRYNRTLPSGGSQTVFTGHVQGWPTDWPSGSDVFATAKITAVDRSARLARGRLRPAVLEEYALDGATAIYTMEEPDGAISAGDTSGVGQAALVPTSDSSAATMAFGEAAGPLADSLTAVRFTASFSDGTSFFSRSLVSAQPVRFPTTTAFTLEAFLSDTNLVNAGGGSRVSTFVSISTQQNPNDTSGTGWTAGIDFNPATNTLRAFTPSGAASDTSNFNPTGGVGGAIQHVAATFSFSGGNQTVTLFVNGSQVATNTVATTWPAPTSGYFRVGSIRGQNATTAIAHAAFTPSALSAARVQQHNTVGTLGWTSFQSSLKLQQIASYAGVAPADFAVASGDNANVPYFDIAGLSAWAALSVIARAEGGVLFIAGDGRIVCQGRADRQYAAVSATISAALIDAGVVSSADMQMVYNTGTVTATGSAAVQSYSDLASIATHGEYPLDMSNLQVATDAAALDALSWAIGTHSQPTIRFPALSIDLMTLDNVTMSDIAFLDISSRLQVTGMPAQAQVGSTTLDLIVEGFTDTVTADSWEWSANTSSWSLARAWLLGDSTYGVLGSTTRLHY